MEQRQTVHFTAQDDAVEACGTPGVATDEFKALTDRVEADFVVTGDGCCCWQRRVPAQVGEDTRVEVDESGLRAGCAEVDGEEFHALSTSVASP